MTGTLSEKMVGVLRVLAEDGQPETPARIARRMGVRRTARRQRGPWAGYMSPAQHIISPLRGLDSRGLIRYARRPDGRSGAAYRITNAGREALREAEAER